MTQHTGAGQREFLPRPLNPKGGSDDGTAGAGDDEGDGRRFEAHHFGACGGGGYGGNYGGYGGSGFRYIAARR